MKETLRSENAARAAVARQKAMMLTGYSDERINQLMFNTAVDYCKVSMGMTEKWMTTWLREPLFWAWWKQQWTLVDEVYWHLYSVNLNRPKVVPELQKRYEKLHREIDRFPDSIVYERIHSSYEVASSRIMKKITAQYEHL